MLIVYKHNHNSVMKINVPDELQRIYQQYSNGKYKATHKRVKTSEFLTLPKIFIHHDCVCVVEGSVRDGKSVGAYIDHCKNFDVEIDRINGIVFLRECNM